MVICLTFATFLFISLFRELERHFVTHILACRSNQEIILAEAGSQPCQPVLFSFLQS